MDGRAEHQIPTTPESLTDQVNRVLEVGRILLSVLTPNELEQLKSILATNAIGGMNWNLFLSELDSEIGNASVT